MAHANVKDFPQAMQVQGKNEVQREHLLSIERNVRTIAIGDAGTGKTFLNTIGAIRLLESDPTIHRIILTRPTVECGEELGSLPGDLDEKFEPWLKPYVHVFNDYLRGGAEQFRRLWTKGIITSMPLQFMRGGSYDNTIMMLDEGQNIRRTQMKMFMTRVGENTRVLISGDTDQSDLPPHVQSGLDWYLGLLDEYDCGHKSNTGVFKYDRSMCLRSDACLQDLELFAHAAAKEKQC